MVFWSASTHRSRSVCWERIPDRIVAEHELQRQRKTDKLRTHANYSSRPKQHIHIDQPVIAQHVLTKRWDQWGEIVENRDNGRSYLVQMNGKQCRFLSPLPKQHHERHKQQRVIQNTPPGSTVWGLKINHSITYRHRLDLRHRPLDLTKSPKDPGHANRTQLLPESTLSDYDRKEHTTRPQFHNPKEETAHLYIESFWNIYFIN